MMQKKSTQRKRTYSEKTIREHNIKDMDKKKTDKYTLYTRQVHVQIGHKATKIICFGEELDGPR